MTLEQAVEVLNRERHGSEANLPWGLYGAGCAGQFWQDGYLTEFEAIAIAEKYERDRPQVQLDPRSITTHPDPVAGFRPELNPL